MRSKLSVRRLLVAFLALCLLATALFALLFAVRPVRAADEDTVTVSGVSVVWGDATDELYLQLQGADFSEVYNQVSNANYGYFMPYISINGALLSDCIGSVKYATKGYFGDATRYRIQLSATESYSLKGDGTDRITIEAGCKIPKTETDRDKDTPESDGVDYYVVSETATFVAPVNAAGTGTEAFVQATPVRVAKLEMRWGAAAPDHLMVLSLDGASFADKTQTTSIWWSWVKEEIGIYVNGICLTSEQVAWVEPNELNGTDIRFQILASSGILRQDGTDVIEIRAGHRIPANGTGSAAYVVSEAARYAATGNSTGTEVFQKQVLWEEKEFDASADVFQTTPAQTDVLGGYNAQSVGIGNMSQDHPE